jgi:hypothetical protein
LLSLGLKIPSTTKGLPNSAGTLRRDLLHTLSPCALRSNRDPGLIAKARMGGLSHHNGLLPAPDFSTSPSRMMRCTKRRSQISLISCTIFREGRLPCASARRSRMSCDHYQVVQFPTLSPIGPTWISLPSNLSPAKNQNMPSQLPHSVQQPTRKVVSHEGSVVICRTVTYTGAWGSIRKICTLWSETVTNTAIIRWIRLM